MKQLFLTFLLLIATAQPARGFEFVQQQCAENPAAVTAFFGLSAMSLLYWLHSHTQHVDEAIPSREQRSYNSSAPLTTSEQIRKLVEPDDHFALSRTGTYMPKAEPSSNEQSLVDTMHTQIEAVLTRAQNPLFDALPTKMDETQEYLDTALEQMITEKKRSPLTILGIFQGQ